MSSPIFRLGLTGGIGCGKSTVAKILQDQGATLIDADEISRALTAPTGLALPMISKVFGKSFLDPSMGLNRVKMRDFVFNDLEAKKKLESIIHPLIANEIAFLTRRAESESKLFIVYDIPLLLESPKWRTMVDFVLVIDCLIETQIARVTTRSLLSRQEVEKIVNAQATHAERREIADAAIYNEGLTLSELFNSVTNLINKFRIS